MDVGSESSSAGGGLPVVLSSHVCNLRLQVRTCFILLGFCHKRQGEVKIKIEDDAKITKNKHNISLLVEKYYKKLRVKEKAKTAMT